MPDDKKPSVGIFGYVRAFIRMWRAYGKKQYRTFPWRTIGILAFAVAYFIFPLDVILDAIPFVGFIDDAAVFGFVIASAKKDIDKFLAWESAAVK
jgi:uncharacterized membrane protein YkvA (DUF1232 family)